MLEVEPAADEPHGTPLRVVELGRPDARGAPLDIPPQGAARAQHRDIRPLDHDLGEPNVPQRRRPAEPRDPRAEHRDRAQVEIRTVDGVVAPLDVRVRLEQLVDGSLDEVVERNRVERRGDAIPASRAPAPLDHPQLPRRASAAAPMSGPSPERPDGTTTTLRTKSHSRSAIGARTRSM